MDKNIPIKSSYSTLYISQANLTIAELTSKHT